MDRLERATVIIGAISSGKSTVAKYVSEGYNVQIASFGGYLKDYCLRNHLPLDRKSLQDIGDEFINNQPENFLLNVIDFSGANTKQLIFEGVRHKIILDLLKQHSAHLLSVFLDVPYEVRKERYLLRNKDIDIKKSSQEFEIANSHPVEKEIPALKDECDIVVSSFDDANLNRQVSLLFGREGESTIRR